MNLGDRALLSLGAVSELERTSSGSADLPRTPRGREADRENAEPSGRVREFVSSCVGLPGVDLDSVGWLSSLPGTWSM